MKTRNRHLLEADPGGLAVNPSPQTVGAPKGWDSRHRLADRVRAHILLCMLACCGEWPMREAWRERLFSGEHLETKSDRDPIAPAACPTQGLEETAASTLPGRLNVRQLADPASGSCFRILRQYLAAVMRNTGITRSPKAASPDSHRVTTATETDHRALQLLQQITV